MAQEGIATLPQSQPVDNPAVDLDATKNAVLGQVGPEAMSAYEQGMTQASSQLNLPPDQLQKLLTILEAILKDPSQYAQIRQQLLQNGVRPEDLPEEFDGGYFTTMLIMVKEALKRAQGQGPVAQGPEPQGFNRGGLADVAKTLASKGRHGDTVLAHINPQEAQMLKAMGGSGTINPHTGLPEFFDLWKEVSNGFNSVGNAVQQFVASPVGKIVSTVALTYLTAGMGVPLVAAAGISAGAVSLAGGSNLKTALLNGLVGAGTAYVAPMISSYMPGAAGSFLNAAATGAVMGTGYGLVTGQSPQNALKMGLTGAAVGGGLQYLGASMPGAGREGGPAPVTDNSTPYTSSEGGVQPISDTSAQANAITQQGGALLPTAGGGEGISQANMQDWLNQQFPGGYQNAPGYMQPAPTGNMSPSDLALQTQNFTGSTAGYTPTVAEQLQNPSLRGSQAPTNAPAPKTGGIMDYVPDFMKSSDGSLSIPMTTATVLGVGALTGGFKTSSPSTTANSAYTGVQRDASGKPVTGTDILNQNPDKYVYKPNITTGPVNSVNPMDPYANNTINPSDPNFVATRQYGQNRQTPYGTFAPPPMSGGQFTGGTMLPQPYNTAGMYDFLNPRRGYAEGGISEIYPRRTGGISGPGTGTSDDIPAMLSDGEFVITAKAVRGAGGGSRREGAKKLYRMMHALEKKAK